MVSVSASEKFRTAIHTLRKYRRSDLRDEEDNSIIDELYVDIFPDDRLIKEFQRDTTAFLIGRRGTGKSTIFEKAQSDLSKSKSKISAYIDVKQVYMHAQVEHLPDDQEDHSRRYERQLLWARSFLSYLVDALVEEISAKAGTSLFMSVLHGGKKRKKEQAIKDVRNVFDQGSYLTQVDTSPYREIETDQQISRNDTNNAAFSTSVRNADISASAGASSTTGSSKTEKFTERAINIFDFAKFTNSLKKALKGLGVKTVIIFLDDYSEIEPEAQKLLIDNVVYPLETASGEFVKFKIAAYPNQFYLGDLDPQKVDFHKLDLSNAYLSADDRKIIDQSSDYVGRLIEKRIAEFCHPYDPEYYFEGDLKAFYRQLYFASNGNPRALGYILDYCSITHSSQGAKITHRSISAASQKYYNDKIERQFNDVHFTNISQEKIDAILLSERILKNICARARELKNNKDGRVISFIESAQIPTSHFHILSAEEADLRMLEHLQFINFFKTLRNKDGKEISIFSLNHGLCQQEKIIFGRPETNLKEGKYFSERAFNYTGLIKRVSSPSVDFICDECQKSFPAEMEETFAIYQFKCPSCQSGTLNKSHEKNNVDVAETANIKKRIPESERVSPLELGFLIALHEAGGRRLRASEIAEEIDTSSHTVGQMGKKLSKKDLVERRKNRKGYGYKLSGKAINLYFNENK